MSLPSDSRRMHRLSRMSPFAKVPRAVALSIIGDWLFVVNSVRDLPPEFASTVSARLHTVMYSVVALGRGTLSPCSRMPSR